MQLASRWKRLGACLLDGIISMAVMLPLMIFTGGFESITQGQGNSFSYTLFMALIGLVVFILIHGRLLYLYGQTVGKKVLGIYIADLDGNTARIKENIIPRYIFVSVLSFIPFVGSLLTIIDALFIFGKNKRCLHDYVGKTIVLDK